MTEGLTHSLRNLALGYGIDIEKIQLHEAEADVLVLWKVLLKMMDTDDEDEAIKQLTRKVLLQVFGQEFVIVDDLDEGDFMEPNQ